MDRNKYRKLFLDEARAHLNALDAEIVQLESAASTQQLDALFRHAHSLKGMAASMGYEPIVQIAHALEDLMDRVRSGAEPVSSSVVDRLLAGHDGLAALVEAVERDEELTFDAALVIYLRGQDAGVDEPVADPLPVAGPETETLEGAWMTVRFSAAAALPAARAFQVAKLVQPFAETFEPSIEDIRAGKFRGSLRIRLNAPPSDELLAGIKAIPDVEEVAELRAPAAAGDVKPAGKQKLEVPSQIRIDTSTLDRFVDMVGELLTVNNQIREISRGLFSEELQTSVQALGRITGDLYQEVLQARMVPFSVLTERLPRLVRDIAQQLGKEVQLRIDGSDVELDRSVMEGLTDPLVHLVRNALDHGVEKPAEREAAGKPAAGKLSIQARQIESQVAIEVVDDGSGIARERVVALAAERGLLSAEQAETLSEQEVFDLLFRPGFSTAHEVSSISGRGVGLDVVKNAIEGLGGEIQISSTPGVGTRFLLRLPARVAIIPVFLVRAGEQSFGLPIAKVLRASWVHRDSLQRIGGRQVIRQENNAVPYFNLANLLGIQESFEDADEIVVFELARGSSTVVIGVDAFLGERDVYLKSAPRPLDRLRGLLGITIIRGEPVFVLDPGMMVWAYV